MWCSRLALVVSALAALSLAPTAQAAQITGGGDVSYEAGPGEANNVTVTAFAGTLTITDTGVVAIVDADMGDNCMVATQTAICTNAFQFNLFLGDLSDRVLAGQALDAGGNTIDGGAGDDTLGGTPGYDEILGGSGDDTIDALGDGDWVDGGDGDDAIAMGEGDDSGTGAAGNDTIDAGPGDDGRGEPVFGGDGSDVLNGGPGDDRLLGDNLGQATSPGGDTLNGGDGDDTFLGRDPGPDVMIGGPGFDSADYRDASPGVTVTVGDGLANDGNPGDGPPGARDDVQGTVELVDGTPGVDVITGSGSGNELRGNAGDDVLDGAGGGDAILGGAGGDLLTGGLGQDLVSGEHGDDTLQSSDGAPDVDQCGIGADTVNGDAADMVFADCEAVSGAVLGGPAGPPGAAGPAGVPGPAGPAGLDGRLVLVAFSAQVSASRVSVRFVLTAAAGVTLEVKGTKGKAVRVASAKGKAGVNTISWNRKLAGKRAARGTYRLTVKASTAGATAASTISARLR